MKNSTSVALLIRNVSSFCSRLLWEVIRLVSLLDRPSLLEWIPTPGIGIFFIRDLCPSQLLGMPGSFSVKTLPRAISKKGVLKRRQERNEKRGIRGGDVAVASQVRSLTSSWPLSLRASSLLLSSSPLELHPLSGYEISFIVCFI